MGKEFFKWSCVSEEHKNCPQLQFHTQEKSMNEVDDIGFKHHHVHCTRCMHHGLLECGEVGDVRDVEDTIQGEKGMVCHK